MKNPPLLKNCSSLTAPLLYLSTFLHNKFHPVVSIIDKLHYSIAEQRSQVANKPNSSFRFDSGLTKWKFKRCCIAAQCTVLQYYSTVQRKYMMQADITYVFYPWEISSWEHFIWALISILSCPLFNRSGISMQTLKSWTNHPPSKVLPGQVIDC